MTTSIDWMERARSCSTYTDPSTEDIARALEAAYDDGRREMREEAAKVCESSDTSCAAVNSSWDAGRNACARAVRALPTTKPAGRVGGGGL